MAITALEVVDRLKAIEVSDYDVFIALQTLIKQLATEQLNVDQQANKQDGLPDTQEARERLIWLEKMTAINLLTVSEFDVAGVYRILSTNFVALSAGPNLLKYMDADPNHLLVRIDRAVYGCFKGYRPEK